ncbi:glycosyltransferase family 2 protein [Solwaraspora sp. WMMD1047]|uniref:glycosyltransferase family 2 protein n=1 Tax=Solwaraspora sp. WMMD1047 TaxID=3016102 RepID=UPI002416AAC5|nr:glycosyltransferase family 2 protein [Solwaraspora sp. WMMD1047]MDG4828826.1 glycosyltransferase family 2 protein [Solwaraspora sp. WMMD1047]
MTPTVSVVMVSYQTRELILRALAALRANCPADRYEVIVVDNASVDGSADAVAAAFPAAQVVRLARNVGFGRAVNVGAGRAAGRWLLLLNPDTEPVGDLIGQFVRFASTHSGHRIYVGRTLRPDGTDDGRSVFGWPTRWGYFCFATGLSTVFRRSRLFNPEELPGLNRAVPARVPAGSGCLLLVDRALFAELAGFTPDYFMYGEDVDLCFRAARLGAVPVLVPQARVRHHNGAASTSVDKRIMLMRGKTTFLRLNWSPGRARAGRALLAAGIAARAAGARLTGRAGYWRAVWTERQTWLAGWPPATDLAPLEFAEPLADPGGPPPVAGRPGPPVPPAPAVSQPGDPRTR